LNLCHRHRPCSRHVLEGEHDRVDDDPGQRGPEHGGRALALAARVEQDRGDDPDQRQQEAADVGGDRDVALLLGLVVDRRSLDA
jgi:hypothetical protein